MSLLKQTCVPCCHLALAQQKLTSQPAHLEPCSRIISAGKHTVFCHSLIKEGILDDWWHATQQITCSYYNAEVGGDIGTYSYSYVPGAGDDEESWARGLTPALFWQHHQVTTLDCP